MKKQHFFRRSRLMLLTLLAIVAGANPAWADTLTENFDEVKRLDQSGNEITATYTYGYSLSNGWFVSPAEGVISASNSYHYGIASGGNTGNALWAAYGPTQSYYLVIPTQLVGEVKFKAKKTSSNSSTKGYIRLYEVIEDNGSYTVTSTQLGSTVEPATNSAWNDYTIDIGDEGKYVALHMIRSGLDDFEATIYEETGIKKPKGLVVSNVTGSSALLSWIAGGEETAWELSYNTTSGDPDNGTIVSLTETSYSLTGLTAETTYYASVRAKVGEEYSAWSKEVSFTPSNAIKLTVNDGTSTNSYIPIYGGYVDAYDKVEFVIPAADLADMTNSDVKELQFYMSSVASASWGAANFKIYMKEVDYTTISGYVFTEDDTPLYNGAIDGTQAEMVLPLSTPYHYNGGNLLIGVYNTAKGTYKSASFYGVSATSGASAYGYSTSSLASVTAVNKQTFLPKTTFTYLPVDGPVLKVSNSSLDFGTVTAESAAEDKSKTFTISNTGTATLEGITVTYSGDNAFSTSPAISAQSIAVGGDAITVTVTMATETPGDYSGTITVSAADQTPVEIAVSGTYAANPATMAITLGEDAVGEAVAFGNVGKQTTKTFTVTNTGNLKLNVSSIVSSNTTDFTVSPSSLTVQGGSSETFTVTFLYDENARDVEKTANITVTASNEGISPVTFAVTGTRIEQWSEDFSGNALPDGWEAETTTSYGTVYGWTFADGVAKGKYYSSSSLYLTTPSLTVESTTDALTFDYVATTNNTDITIQKSKDGGAWETCTTTPSIGSLNTGNSGTATITGLEAGNYKFRFKSDNYNLDNFQGFKRNQNDPKLGIYSDAACTTAVATSVKKDFGFATAAQSATYYIKNDGTGTMTLSLGENPDGITASLDKISVTAGEHATLTITMSAENKGYNSGNVVVTATDLGTFTVAAEGVVVDENKLNLDFATASIPATWTVNDWTKNANGYIENTVYGSRTIETAVLTAAAGEELIVEAQNMTTTSSYTFGINYKKQGDAEWSTLIEATNIGTEWKKLHATIAEAGKYQLQFVGGRAQIRHIYGLAELNEPVMVVYDGETVAAATYNFGNVSDAADAVKVFTVKNEGKAALTGLAAAVSGDNASHYSVEVSATTVAVNQTATVTVRQLKDNIGAHTATLTISATGLDNKVISLSGNTYDHTKLFVDFEDGNLPTGWTKGSNWNVSQSSGNYSLGHRYGSSSASSVVTTPLTVAENEVLTFGAARYYASYAPTLKVRYTADGGLTWSDYTDFSSEITNSYAGNTFKELTLTGVPAGTVVLEFYGNYVRLDNIYGFAPTTAPLLALTEGSTAVANNSTKDFGTLTAAATATYTLKNNGNGDMVSTVSTTGVATVAISGSDVTVSDNQVTVPAGKSATITLTIPYESPYGDKSGAMTIKTEGWVADFTINYTATTVDPTALYVDFANNTKPDGWYSDGWSYTNNYASAAYVANKQLITQKLTCAGENDVLSFDVWPYTSSYGTYANALTVEYSTDRQNWTAFANQPTFDVTENQTIQVSGVAAGEYYVRFTGSYVYLDNILGWHKVTGIDHDLYVSYTNIPSETKVPETSIQATATVYSLRADETGVYAKLFFGDNEIATAQAKDIAKDGSTNFSLTGNVPAEEGTYAARIVVYYSDNTVAFETLTTDVEVAHTRTLAVTAFALASDATAVADANNQFSPTFTVTVKNTGTTAVSVAAMVKDADGAFVGSAAATEPLAAGSETTLTIIAGNISAGEGGELSYYASAWTGNDEFAYATPVTINVTASAPKFALYQDATPVNNGDDIDFGLVREATTYHYIIKNEGTAALELISIEAPQGFTTTALTSSNKTIAQGGSLDIDVTLQAEQGKVAGNLVITYKVDAQTNKTFTLALSGRSISEDTWTVAFDGTQTQIPSDWTNNGGWQIAGVYSSYPNAAYSFGSASWLATPRLAATQGEQLTFDVSGSGLSLKVEYSTNFADWTAYETITTAGEHSFEAPAAGSYYLRFTGTYAYLTNFVGFRLNPYTATLADTRNFDATNYVMGPCAEATLGRSFGAGWGTLVLPFDVDAATVQDKFGEGTKLYTLTAYDDGELTFGRHTAGNIVAGTPYLVYLPAAIDANALVFENVVMGLSQNDVTINGAQFKGNYEAGMSMAGMYGVTPAGKMQKGGSNATMKAFRAYIVLPANVSAARIAIDETGTTGITRVLGDEQVHDEPAYNLQGQRVASPRKGFYIVGGKKVFKK